MRSPSPVSTLPLFVSLFPCVFSQRLRSARPAHYTASHDIASNLETFFSQWQCRVTNSTYENTHVTHFTREKRTSITLTRGLQSSRCFFLSLFFFFFFFFVTLNTRMQLHCRSHKYANTLWLMRDNNIWIRPGVQINGELVTGVQINDKLIIGLGARCFITKSVHYKFKPIKVISGAFTPNILYTFAINRVACDAQNPQPRELKRNNVTRRNCKNFDWYVSFRLSSNFYEFIFI